MTIPISSVSAEELKKLTLEADLLPLATNKILVKDFSNKYGCPTVVSQILKHLTSESYMSAGALPINEVTNFYFHPEQLLGKNYKQLIEFFKVLEEYSPEEIMKIAIDINPNESGIKSPQFKEKKDSLIKESIFKALEEETKAIITRGSNQIMKQQYIESFTKKVLKTSLTIIAPGQQAIEAIKFDGFHLPTALKKEPLTYQYLISRVARSAK